jgi:hypothetical protein
MSVVLGTSGVYPYVCGVYTCRCGRRAVRHGRDAAELPPGWIELRDPDGTETPVCETCAEEHGAGEVSGRS